METSFLLEQTLKNRQKHRLPRMPASIRHLGPLPLYRAVAWWGLYLAREFDRDDICRAFQISPRQASNVICYLCRRDEQRDIVLETRKVRDRRVIQVLEIIPPGRRSAGREESRPEADEGQERQMVRWLLSRPVGDDVGQIEAWIAAFPGKKGT